MLAVGVAIILGALGGSSTAATHSAASGRFSGMVGIGHGRKLFLTCRGTGGPTVVLIAGFRGSHDDWTHIVAGAGKTQGSPRAVFPRVAGFTHVCAYDRPGTTDLGSGAISPSTPVRQPTTAQDGVADLHALLHAAGVNGPYVIVAHSWGGMIGQLYARTHPGEVAGLVFLDPGTQYLKRTLTPGQWRKFAAAARQLGDPSTLEAAAYEPSVEAMLGAPPVPHVPAVVLSSDHPFPFGAGGRQTWPAWVAAQNLFAHSIGASHITDTDSGHYIAGDAPAIVVAAIHRVWTETHFVPDASSRP